MPSFIDRHFRSLLLLIWAFGCGLMLVAGREAIGSWRMGDPDDQLRLLQVHDWIAGQSWWDITQYRMNLPDGGDMHWSRLVDIPIAAIILLCRPFFGPVLAEHIAVVAVPLLTFGVVLALYAATARKLFGTKAAMLAALLFITILPAITQLMPMRIDHHGWQLASFFVAALALFDTARPLRAALIAGAALALWIEISIEGLPFAVLFMAIFGWRWLVTPTSAQGTLGFSRRDDWFVRGQRDLLSGYRAVTALRHLLRQPVAGSFYYVCGYFGVTGSRNVFDITRWKHGTKVEASRRRLRRNCRRRVVCHPGAAMRW
jgi:hypothetical protein